MSAEFKDEFKQLIIDMLQFSDYRFPRFLGHGRDTQGSLLILCDGSLAGYGSVAYWRTGKLDEEGTARVIMSKSKVTTHTVTTAPKSELQGAQLSAWIFEKIRKVLEAELDVQNVIFLTDSTVVLSQIASNSFELDKFTCRRINYIQKVTDGKMWCHIEGNVNPADYLTRAKATKQDIETFTHARVLCKPIESWPIKTVENLMRSRGEKKTQEDGLERIEGAEYVSIMKMGVQPVEAPVLQKIIEKANSWTKAVVTLMYVLKFGSKSHKMEPNNKLMVTARNMLIKFEQERSTYKSFPPKSMETVKVDGIIYLVQRPVSDGSEGEYHPSIPILPPNTELGNLIIEEFHNDMNHCKDPRRLNLMLSKEIIIMKAIRQFGKYRRNCASCNRFAAETKETFMGPIPEEARTPSKPFSHLLIDIAGPFQVVDAVKKRTPMKAWALVISCIYTRAVQAYTMEKYDAIAVVDALNRHRSHHGDFVSIYSDNGTQLRMVGDRANKTGSQQEEATLRKVEIAVRAVYPYCTFHHSPPSAPWAQGGVERMIGMMKKTWTQFCHKEQMRAMTILDVETLLARITAKINDRPLTLGPEGSVCITPKELIHNKTAQDEDGDLFDPIDHRAKGEQAFRRWVKIFEATVTPRGNFHRHRMRKLLKPGDVVLMTDYLDSSGKFKTARVTEMITPRRLKIEYMKNGKKVDVQRHPATLALIERPSERQD